MRRGTWILAISGVMALNNGVSFAADPSQGTPPGGQRPLTLRGRQATPPSAGLPSKYLRDAAAADKLAADKTADKAVAEKPAADKAPAKNYYDELFTEQTPAAQQPTAAAGWEADSPAATTAAATPAAPPAKPPVTKTASAALTRGQRPTQENSHPLLVEPSRFHPLQTTRSFKLVTTGCHRKLNAK